MKRFLLAVLAMVPVISSASPITIDFGPSFGAPSTGHSVLTNQLASYGVTFSTTNSQGVYLWGADYGWAPAAYSITAGDSCKVADCAMDPIRVDFAAPVASASIRGFDGGGDTDTMVVKAFDSNNVLLDMITLDNEFSDPGFVATVYGANISYFTFEVAIDLDPPIAGATHGLFFDDLSFEPAIVTAVPLPNTFLLLGLGLLALAARRVKRSQQ